MTVAVKENIGGVQTRRLGLRLAGGGGNPWRRLWQVPLLLAGLVGFGFGVRALARSIRPIPFQKQADGVRTLLERGDFDKAIEQINILGDYYKKPVEQGELQVLAGDTHYLAQQQQPAVVRANFEHVEDHYRKALLWGVQPTVQMNQRWGEAALALGDAKTAMDKLEAAIAGNGSLIKLYAKPLTAAYLESGKGEKALSAVDRLLTADEEKPEAGMDGIHDRTWALCKRIEIALAGVNAVELTRVVEEARQALETLNDRDSVGRILAWIGRAELSRGEIEKAEGDLTEARAHFAVHHLDDGRAAVLLGKIEYAHGHVEKADGLFKEVVVGHAGTSVWAAARLGRADVAVKRGDAGATVSGDYRFAINAIEAVEGGSLVGKGGTVPVTLGVERPPVGEQPELITRDGVRSSLLAAYEKTSKDDHLEDALLFLALQQEMGERETPELAFRLATTKERRAAEIMAAANADENEKDRIEKIEAARRMYADAAADYLRHAKLTTLTDADSANSIWKAAELLDRAGQTMRAAAVYEQFTIQRPRDARVPEGMLALGRLYDSAGMLDKAIAIFERNIKENPRTPAAYTSAVSLARCYERQAELAATADDTKKGLDKAEEVLLSLVQDNTDLEPTAREFREGLLALGELYYRSGRWGAAILRLQEMMDRYPEDAGLPRTLFLLGESYRKSAGEIAEALKKDTGINGRAALESARLERLQTAAGILTRVIGILDVEARQGESGSDAKAPVLTALEAQSLRTSYMDRADCYFARGEYEAAIKLYDQTAARFSDERIAAEAYVQVVNAYLALKDPAQASAAAQRGQWVLKRIPDEAFQNGLAGTGRAYYEKLLALGRN